MTYVDFDRNVYYNPEKSGLTIIGDVDLDEPCYSFDLLVVWKLDSTGYYYVGQDSGCSCPSPFERVTSLEYLEGPFTKNGVIAYLENFDLPDYYNKDYYGPKIVDLIGRIRNLV